MPDDTLVLDAPTTTAAASAPPAPTAPTIPGTPYAGGYFVGRLRVAGVLHLLVVAPKDGGTLKGAWHADGADIPAARDCADGLANTRAMAEAGSTLAQQALACRIGGFEDWHIPSRDALELMYRHLKPTTRANYCSYRDGDNPSSEPTGYPYTKDSPAQTTAEAFRNGGPEALEDRWHWSSTQGSADGAYDQYFGDGTTDAGSKVWDDGVARLVRQIPQPFTL